MVAAALIVLAENWAAWIRSSSLIIIGREITISALREWMAQVGPVEERGGEHLRKVEDRRATGGDSVPALQRRAVRVDPHQPGGHVLIWIAAVLTLWSMVVYLKARA